VVLKLGELCSFTDYMVIATGRSTRHVQGVADRLRQEMKETGEAPFGVEGFEDGLWVLLDYLDVVVNLFYESHREYYDLEGFWADAPRVRLAGAVPKKLLAESPEGDEKW
jgi:ribosome-associated protein